MTKLRFYQYAGDCIIMNRRERMRRRELRRASDHNVSQYFVGFLLFVIGTTIAGIVPLIFQWAITSTDAVALQDDPDAIHAKSFMTLLLLSITLASAGGKIVRNWFFKNGWIRLTGLVLGLNLGYMVFLTAAVISTSFRVEYSVPWGTQISLLILITLPVIKKFFEIHWSFENKPHPNAITK